MHAWVYHVQLYSWDIEIVSSFKEANRWQASNYVADGYLARPVTAAPVPTAYAPLDLF